MTPSKEQEAQQVQTIAEIRERHIVPDVDMGRGGPVANSDCVALLKIVDSQAQKIAELEKDLKQVSALLAAEYNHTDELEKEVERLKKLDSLAESARIDKSLTEYYRKSL